MSLARFTEIWTLGDYPPEPVAEADLRSVEQRLNLHLPEDSRKAALEVGLPRPTIALLDAIVERELELHSLVTRPEAISKAGKNHCTTREVG